MSEHASSRRHWLNPERLVLLSLPVLATILAMGWLWLEMRLEHLGTPLVADFITFWSASSLTLSGHPEAAYDLARISAVAQAAVPGFGGVVSWHYPPTFLLLVWPLALLPIGSAWFVFIGLSFVLYAGALYFSLAPLLRAAHFGPLRRLLQVLLPLLAFGGVATDLIYGQNGFLTAGLMASGLVLLRHKPWQAGLCFGLLAIKPHLALLLPLALACARQWRAFAGAALSACGSLLLSVALFGWASLQGFLTGMARARHWLEADGQPRRLPVLPEQIDASWVEQARLSRNAIPSLFSFLRQLEVSIAWAYALHALLALLVALIVARAWRGAASWPLRFALLSCGSVLVTPYLFDYELCWLALPLCWAVVEGVQSGWRRGEREFLLLLGLLPLPMFLLARVWPLPFALSLPLACFLYLAIKSERALCTAKVHGDERSSERDERTSESAGPTNGSF